MRLPRVRFTVRRMMVAVAVLALLLVVATPVAKSLYWLWNTPSRYVYCPIKPLPYALMRPVPVGGRVPMRCLYECEISTKMRPYLPYRVVVEFKLVDRATGNVEEASRRTHLLVSGFDSMRKVRSELNHTMTPRHPGAYTFRYEVRAMDIFGDDQMITTHNSDFAAR